jgi:hypothetical protein
MIGVDQGLAAAGSGVYAAYLILREIAKPFAVGAPYDLAETRTTQAWRTIDAFHGEIAPAAGLRRGLRVRKASDRQTRRTK